MSIGRLRKVDGRSVFVLNPGVRIPGAHGEYRIVGSRGHGGFAYAYAVREVGSGQLAILKMSSERQKNGFGGERIRREALVLRHCARQEPSLFPKLLDEGEIDGRPFFILENLEPLSWSEDELGLPDSDDKRRLFFMLMIDSVRAIHQAGYLHCDIKPANIMQRAGDRYRHPLLIDFGSAHPIMNGPRCCQKMPPGWVEVTKKVGRAYTEGYDADGDEYTIQKDIFAIGQVMRDSFGKEVDLAWGEIINKCISRRREFRYETLDDLRADVENVPSRRRKIYWNFRKDRIREQRETERSLSEAEPETIRRDKILRRELDLSSDDLKVFSIKFPRMIRRHHYILDEPIVLGESTVLFISGRGILEANITGPSTSVVVLKDYAVLHNQNDDLPPANDLTYVIVGPGSYLNFPLLEASQYREFFPNRRRILRDIDATTSFRFNGPLTFSGVEEESLAAIEESAMPQCYKDVLRKFFKGEDFTVLPRKAERKNEHET